MKNRVFVILKEDIIDFPPILSIMRVLAGLEYEVIHLGTYSDNDGKSELGKLGIKFQKMPQYNGKANLFNKLYSQISFRNEVNKFLSKASVTNNDIIWIPQIETIYLHHDLPFKYPVILHPLEFTNPSIGWKYRLISPTINLTKSFNAAKAVVCCEYNRSQITKGIYGLERLPFILPNKPYINDNTLVEPISIEIKNILRDFKDRTQNKKIILYQGIFLDRERRLEEFCESISLLPDDFVLVAMGRGGDLYENLRKKYEGDRIIFIPFIKPPFHLGVTKNAYIGVLSYFPRPDNIGTVINPLYCAPNKIYEYSKYGKPMIANDIPGLHYIFQQFHCGECMPYPITAHTVMETIKAIDSKYDYYSNGAIDFYDSEKIDCIIKDIVNFALKS